MDVYTAKLQLQKMIAYIDTLSNDNHRMYNKSKDRWNEIRSLSMQLAQSISSLLKSAAMEDVDDSFGESDHEIDGVIRSIQSEIDAIKQFVNYKETTAEHSKQKIPFTVKQSTIQSYHNVLTDACSKSTGFIEANECLRLIQIWFHSRFIANTSDFKYNIQQLPVWIQSFCIGYSESVQNNRQEEFKSSIISWCDKLSDEHIKYAVPYEIYQICTDDLSEHLTLTSVVLWDMMMEAGLNKFENLPDKYDLFVTESDIYDMCNKYSPNLLDDYVDYRVDDRHIFQKAKIHRC